MQNNVYAVISSAASAFSIVGVVITLFEIIGVKSKTKAVRDSLANMSKELRCFYSYSKINEMARMIDEIESYLRNNSMESCYITLKELKAKLVVMNENWKKEDNNQEFIQKMRVCIYDLGMDIKSLYSSLKQVSPLDDMLMNTHLENIKELLNKKAGQIKSDKL